MKRAAIYLRQSLDVQEGISRQRERCRALVAARDWELFDEYIDNDVSASKPRGADTAWPRLLADLDRGVIDVVVTVDLDRLLRTIKDLVQITERGAAVTTVDGDLDLSTADGEFRATLGAALARFEVRRKGERQIRAQAQAAAAGRRVGGRRPFGFEQDGMTVRDDEAAAIRQGYDDLLSGVPLAAIARGWNARGLATAQVGWRSGQPGRWRRDNVRAVLRNPRYAGLRAYKGEVVAAAAWPALVPEETWRAADDMLGDRARPKGGGARRLLSGLALCGVCGIDAGVTVHAGGATRDYPMYRCSGSYGHVGRRAEPVENFVETVVVERLSRPDARELLTDAKRPDVAALRSDAQALRGRLDTLALEFADGDLTPSQLRVATDRLRDRLASVESKMTDAGRVSVLGPLVGAADVRAKWDGYGVDRKRAVIDALCQVVVHPAGRGTRTFRPETVLVRWNR